MIELTHIGGADAAHRDRRWRILTDPTFDPPGRRYDFGWGTSSRKTTGPAVPADVLAPIDAVLLSHDHHGDNLDTAGRALLQTAQNVVTTASGAGRLGRGARGLVPWATTTFEAPGRPTIEVTATPCRHGPPLSHALAGDVIGFALRWNDRHGALWISGDTVLYDGVRRVADLVQVDVAILHLGGVRFPLTGPVRYSMTGADAVTLCGLLHPETVVPVHYEGWGHFREGRAAAEREIARAPAAVARTFRWLPLGTRTTVGS